MGYNYPDPMNAIHASRILKTTPAQVQRYLKNGRLRGTYHTDPHKCKIRARDVRRIDDIITGEPGPAGPPVLFPMQDGVNWSKIVWALEESARKLENEGYTVEHDYIVNRLVSKAILVRDTQYRLPLPNGTRGPAGGPPAPAGPSPLP